MYITNKLTNISRCIADIYIHQLAMVYVLVITPLRGIWCVYTHDARGRIAPEGRGRIYQPNHEEGVL